MAQRFGWGHINVNVSNLEASIAFYELLGFSVFIPGIPYLGLTRGEASALPDEAATALGVPMGTQGRACIMQLDNSFPKLDLTELNTAAPAAPLQNKDVGVVRLCLVSQNIAEDHAALEAAGVVFLSAPQPCPERLADVAVCADPDGTLIELLQVYLERWPAIPGVSG